MKKSKFHFVKAVIMKSAAGLGYWSLFSRSEDKMSNFLTKLLMCYVSLFLYHWEWGGEKERRGSCWNVYKKYTGWYSLSVLFYSGYQCILKNEWEREKERGRDGEREPTKYMTVDNFLILNKERECRASCIKCWKC